MYMRLELRTHGQNEEYLLSRRMHMQIKTNFTGLTKLVLNIRSSSYEDMIPHVHTTTNQT